ncbi:protein dissatisfaction [Rhipicephalus sanguineus]|nr:protein dissatisfaction [Rhipicephalus sanguineus]
MLLNAERSQELIWNSVRMGGGGGGGGTAMNNSFGGGPPSGLSAKLGAEGGLSAFSLLSSSTHPFGSLEEAALRQRLQGSGATQPCPWGNTGGGGSVQEVTARLLFMVIRWVKCLPTFQTLSKSDQVTLLEESWKDLFLLYMAQWSVAADIVSSLPGLKGGNGPSPTAANSLRLHQSDHLDGAPSSPQRAAELHYIQDVMRRLRQLSPDDTECSCLKAVVLFKPETIGLCDVHPVEMLQDQAQCVLGDYIRHKHPRQPTRFGRLLLLLPSLRAVSAATVERLFFRDTIGNIPIERILGDMYNMEKVD